MSCWLVNTGTVCGKKPLKLLRLSVREKRFLVQQAKDEYDVRLLCGLLELSHSSFYYTVIEVDDSWLRKTIETICLEKPRCGYRRVTNLLHRVGTKIGPDKVRRLIAEMGLSVRRSRPKVQTTRSGKGKPLYPNLMKHLEI